MLRVTSIFLFAERKAEKPIAILFFYPGRLRGSIHTEIITNITI
jgi:hypothetical protein